jgi:hypothetical protein
MGQRPGRTASRHVHKRVSEGDLNPTRPPRGAPGGTGWAWSCRSRSPSPACPSANAWPCTRGSIARRGTSTRPSPWSVSPGRRARSAPGCRGGQRRRLDFALALIGDPALIFLDEPTTGFDPCARRAAWEVIAGLRHLGKTIFLTTHYMYEAEYLADRIAVHERSFTDRRDNAALR